MSHFSHCPHQILRSGKTEFEPCRGSFGPGTQEEVNQALAEHCAQWHPEQAMDAEIATATAEGIRETQRMVEAAGVPKDANGYEVLAHCLRETRETLTAALGLGDGFACVVSAAADFGVVLERLIRAYENADPHELLAERLAGVDNGR